MQLNFDNRGGISRLYAIPSADVIDINTFTSHDIATATLSRSSGIIEIPFYPGHSYNFHERHTITEQGDIYNVNISGIIPSQLVNDNMIDTLRHGEWLVAHKDRRGFTRLSGTKLVPLRFTCASTSGSEHAELNGQEFEFTAKEENSSPVCKINVVN